MFAQLKFMPFHSFASLLLLTMPVMAQSWECRGEASSYFSNFDGKGKIRGGSDGYVGRYVIRPVVPGEAGLIKNEGMMPTHVVIADGFDGILAQFYDGIGTGPGLPVDRTRSGQVVFSINAELGRFVLTDFMTYLADTTFREPYFEIGYCRKLTD